MIEELTVKVSTRGYAYLADDFQAHIQSVVYAINTHYWAEPGSSLAGFRGQVIAEAYKWLLDHDIAPKKVQEVLE